MRTVDTHGTFEEILEGATDQVEEISRRLREIIVEVYPDVVEVPWPTQRIAGYGVGPKKMTEHFCYIGVLKDRANLGFYYGADLPDPNNLLDGTGKNMRHIKVTSVEMADLPEVRALLMHSVAERKSTLGI